MDELKRVQAWVQLCDYTVLDFIEIPDDCFNDDGSIIESEAIEYVERWISDKLLMRYGCRLPPPPAEPQDLPEE
jgi:hypothetical protein